MNPAPSQTQRREGFTLVELMLSTAIIALLMIVLAQMTGQTSATWQYTTGKAEQFREARTGFETMVRRISQATLNTYWDYDDPLRPTTYVRQSELRFACGPMQTGSKPLDSTSTPPRPTHGIFFQAPFGFVAPASASDSTWKEYQGLASALNTWGYYLEVDSDKQLRPSFISEAVAPLRIRSRLMEMMQPTGAMNIYRYTSGTAGTNPAAVRGYKGFDWFRSGLSAADGSNAQLEVSHVLAENIVALAILPKLAETDARALNLKETQENTILAPGYYYHSGETGEASRYTGNLALAGAVNSKHQLPPVIQVTMVAIDEKSAQHLNVTDAADDPLKVRDAAFLTNASLYDSDLLLNADGEKAGTSSLEQRLIDAKLNYRIFTTNVNLRGAKWSREQNK